MFTLLGGVPATARVAVDLGALRVALLSNPAPSRGAQSKGDHNGYDRSHPWH